MVFLTNSKEELDQAETLRRDSAKAVTPLELWLWPSVLCIFLEYESWHMALIMFFKFYGISFSLFQDKVNINGRYFVIQVLSL